MMARRWWAVISSGLALTLFSPRAYPCAPAPPLGEKVRVADETALIVWNESTHIEHFIRKASFLTTTASFGFLVPTPTIPELAEAREDIFERLDDATRPNIIVEHVTSGIRVAPICASLTMYKSEAPPPLPPTPPVRVLSAQRVAGYDAVVLEADDSGALASWLTERGYGDSATLREWLTPYIATHAKITAFKVASDSKSKALATTAVRMTFKADRPFFPYREPSEQRSPNANVGTADQQHRLLRIFFVGASRMEGFIGEAGLGWPGKLRWSDKYTSSMPTMPTGVTLPAVAWLSMFEDESFPRPGTDDLYFRPSADTSPLLPAPIVEREESPLFIPLEPLLLVAGVGWAAWRKRKRKQNEQE